MGTVGLAVLPGRALGVKGVVVGLSGERVASLTTVDDSRDDRGSGDPARDPDHPNYGTDVDQLITEDPTRIGPYRLIARLGAGGMGLVYLGRSEAGRTVAVKVVQAEHAQHPEFRRRFAREVEAARRVGGEWTAAVLDADTEAPVPWVATQYIPGPDLTNVVAKDFGPLPEQSVRVLANRLAVALQSVHAAGLIHRDLKPSNVLVTVDGPRVIDFGIARAMDGLGGDSLHTRTGMLIGSPGFMSPEQVRGLELTPASDVFCLGAVLVYASTGRLLFGATDTGLSAHLFRIAEDEPDLTGVPDSLIDLVRACLHKDPAQRPTPADVAARTAADLSEEWLPGAVLAQLGRHAARLLDFAPETRVTPQDPRIPAQHTADPRPVPPQPAYSPTAPVDHAPVPPGFGPALGTVPGAWGAPTAPAHPSGSSSRRWWGLVAAVLAQFLIAVGAMSTNVALPIIQADLRLSVDDLQLMSFAYVIAFGVLLLLGGHLADLLGRKRMVIIGLAGFAVVSAVGGAAPAGGVLITAHALQGVFAALLSSAALSLVAGGFTDPKARGTAFGIYTVFAGGGLAVGGFVGSWLAYYVSWRWSLYAAVPLALMAVVPAALVEDDRSARTPARPDVPGLLLGTGALAALVFGFHQVEETHGFFGPAGGWTSPLAVLFLLAGAALLAAFVWWQTRTSSPLVQPGLFRDRDRAGSLLALLLAGVGAPTLFLTLSLYLQDGLDYTPYDLGLALLPLGGAVLVATQVAGRLQGRIAPRLLAVPGLVLAAAGMGLLALQDLDGSYASAVLPGIVLFGLGIGTAFGPLLATATGMSGFQGSGGTAATVLAAQGFGGWLAFPLFVGLAPLGGYAAVLWTVTGFLLLASLLAGLMVRTSAPQRDR
ncbi:bifunctional serine/threonine protein kinase/MFS transporter [Streptomyces nymphaeiformis]|uniref:Serine/threonine protein kinase/MFS family permease n=1 Tax=Streptomyces nymphaeiformis TaxID=2663842 RepID=A0A7W7TYA9_9ACTN|nr:serine/threonine protein kinase/MFS family permease [Streptomyces nymphaeiformis]